MKVFSKYYQQDIVNIYEKFKTERKCPVGKESTSVFPFACSEVMEQGAQDTAGHGAQDTAGHGAQDTAGHGAQDTAVVQGFHETQSILDGTG